MDLSRMTRSELEREAMRRGVRDARQMSREALIAAIEERRGGGRRRRALGVAKALLGAAVDAARSRVPEGVTRRLLDTLAPRLGPGPAVMTHGAPPPAPAVPADRAQPKPVAADARPAARRASRDTIEDAEHEPIPTRTMARLLADQSHYQRALAIYGRLIEKRPDDRDLRREADAVRERARASRTRPADGEEDDAGARRQEVVSVRVDPETVLVSWEVSDVGIARAGELLGTPGTLTARVVVVAPDPNETVVSETREKRPVDRAGEWIVGGLPRGAHATAAIGVASGDRFVSIAHAPVVPPS